MEPSREAVRSEYNLPFTHHSDALERIVASQRNYLIFKRSMDIIGAIVGILVLSPILLFIALIIKAGDPKAPILFKQIRVGLHGHLFQIYKFRSMVVNAEDLLDNLIDQNEVSGAMFKMKDDPRVTRIGHFIRRTSLDELPQLFNVLRGNMSLVGPRPPLPREVANYSVYDKQRLLVRPGCTGLWQISGRSNLGFEEMVRLDLKYITNRNLGLDLKIILKTIGVLFGSKNAF
ncbi:MAG: sugar transferase [Sporolactobacillus sp.]